MNNLIEFTLRNQLIFFVETLIFFSLSKKYKNDIVAHRKPFVYLSQLRRFVFFFVFLCFFTRFVFFHARFNYENTRSWVLLLFYGHESIATLARYSVEPRYRKHKRLSIKARHGLK